MATVIRTDVGCLIGEQQVLADLVDLGGGVSAFQLKTSSSGGGGGVVTQGTVPWSDNIAQWGGVVTSLGQKVMASSLPVTIASDQSVVPVDGNVASATADIGNPVKVGGKYNAIQPTLADGERGDIQLDINSNQIVDFMRLDPANDGIGAAKVGSQAVAVTTSGGGYVSGCVVGGIISLPAVNFAVGRRVTLQSLQLNDKNGNAVALNIYLFKSSPSAGTYTDNTSLVWGAGDSANKVGQVTVKAGDWITDNSQSSVNFSDLRMKMPVTATTLYFLIIVQGVATFTNGNLTMNLEFDQE